MLSRFRRLIAFFAPEKPARAAKALADPPAQDATLAQAALLVHAAMMDGAVTAPEEAALKRLLAAAFKLDSPAVAQLLTRAREREAQAADLYQWTRAVNDSLDEDQKIHLVEHLWEIVYADGKLDAYEANLLRRVAGLLYVSDRAAAEARHRVLERNQS